MIRWEKVISNFVWILGAAIILAALSYQGFLAHLRREFEEREKKGREISKNLRENLMKVIEIKRKRQSFFLNPKRPFVVNINLDETFFQKRNKINK